MGASAWGSQNRQCESTMLEAITVTSQRWHQRGGGREAAFLP